MLGRPVLSGAVHLTSRLVVDPVVADTEGAPGASGASFWSVTFSVTAIVADPLLPSSTLTVTA